MCAAVSLFAESRGLLMQDTRLMSAEAKQNRNVAGGENKVHQKTNRLVQLSVHPNIHLYKEIGIYNR